MNITNLSMSAMTLYAELREQAMALGLRENLGSMPGSVNRKVLKGQVYLYYQYDGLDGRKVQLYLGPDNEETRRAVDAILERRADRHTDHEQFNLLRKAFIAAGGAVVDVKPMRVLKAFADSGLLHPMHGGAVLVGTHAFQALGNALGVRWASHARTQDIDIGADDTVTLGIGALRAGAQEVLERLQLGFLPVPALDPREPSTSFFIRGQEMRVDLLTPLTGSPGQSKVYVGALKAYAQRVRFLDFLLSGHEPGLVVGGQEALLVNLPKAERYALHKLLVSEDRPSAFATKSEKDRHQAVQLLQVLLERGGAGLVDACEDLARHGAGWVKKARAALKKCAWLDADVVGEFEAEYGGMLVAPSRPRKSRG